MSKLVSYGCSFTKWRWLTWPAILSKNLALKNINQGRVGCGNNYILKKLKNDLAEGLIDPTDKIRIMWCHYNRQNPQMDANINETEQILYQPENSTDKKSKIKNFYNNIEILLEAESILQDYDYEFYTWLPLKDDGLQTSDKIDEIENYNLPKFKKEIKPPLIDVVMEGNWGLRIDYAISFLHTPKVIRKNVEKQAKKQELTLNQLIRQNATRSDERFMIFWDYHPTPIHHLEYLQKIYPNLKWNTDVINEVKKENNIVLEKIYDD